MGESRLRSYGANGVRTILAWGPDGEAVLWRRRRNWSPKSVPCPRPVCAAVVCTIPQVNMSAWEDTPTVMASYLPSVGPQLLSARCLHQPTRTPSRSSTRPVRCPGAWGTWQGGSYLAAVAPLSATHPFCSTRACDGSGTPRPGRTVSSDTTAGSTCTTVTPSSRTRHLSMRGSAAQLHGVCHQSAGDADGLGLARLMLPPPQ